MVLPPKGLYTDCNSISQPQGTWREARNIIVNKQKQAFTNELGTDLTATAFPFTLAKPMGTTPLPNGSYVVYAMGTTGEDRIGRVSDLGIYTDIIIDDALNFNSLFPIRSSEFDYNAFSEVIIGFTDRNNNPRILNIDNLPFPLNPDKSLVNPADISDMEIFTKIKPPNVTYSIRQQGGSIKSGAYSPAFAYENNDGTRTPNCPPMQMIYIQDDGTSVGFDQFDGVAPNTITSKAISFSLTNVDTRYDKLVLILVKKNNGITTAVEVKKISISGPSVTIAYTGTELEVPLSLEEVLTPKPLYNKVGCMAQINSQLFLADLEADVDIDFQQYANLIKVYYNSKIVKVADLNTSNKNSYPGGFAHGGVYALYIAFLLKNGSLSRAFHIPGRVVAGSELSSPGLLPTDPSPLVAGSGVPNGTKRYQIEDTTNRSSNTYNFDISDNTWISTKSGISNMGYWENQDEVYPADFPGGLAGQKVRHHVFPSIQKCKDTHYSSDNSYGRDYLDILGIDIENVSIPSDIQDKIEGWVIMYAQRDYINSNTLGNDLWLVAHKTDSDPNMIWSAGGNWRGKSFDDSGQWEEDFVPNLNYLRGHSFELLKDKPALAASSLIVNFELKYRRNNSAGEVLVEGNLGGNIAKSGQDEGSDPGALIDLAEPTNTVVSTVLFNNIRQVQEFKYYPNNIIDGNVRTFKNEEIHHVKIFNGDNIPYSPSEVHANSQGRGAGPFINAIAPFINGGEDSYLLTYKQLKTNLFTEYNNQILVTTNVIAAPTDSNKLKIRGGDTFLNLRSFLTVAPRHPSDFESLHGTTTIRQHIAESRYNIGLRYEVIGQPTTKYYPKTKPQDFWTNPSDPDEIGVEMIFTRSENPNGMLGISDDYSTINNYNQPVIFDPSQRLTNLYPYRVLRGGVADTSQNSINGWRTFLSGNFYESNRNRGRIINLANYDNTLLIHHTYGLFRTISDQKLSLETTEVTIGTQDIFANRPKEPVATKLGFLGTQNIFACLSFKDIYFWCDQSQGRVFILKGGSVAELSDNGMYNFFRDNLKIDNTYPDSPIEGQGIIAAYDPKFERIILVKKSNSNSWTKSFSFEKDQNYWVGDHDYTPDYMFNTSTDLYAFKSNKIWKYGSTIKRGVYFDSAPFPSYIKLVFNQEADNNDVFQAIAWISEMFNTIGEKQVNNTITSIQANTSYQDTGEILLIPHTSFTTPGNIRRYQSTWRFNKFKEANADVWKRKILIDNYCEVKLKYDNHTELDSSQNSLYLYLASISANPAEL